MTQTNEQELYPDWAESGKGQVYKAIFNQIHDFDRNVGGHISTASMKGIRQYIGRNVSSMNASGYLSEGDTSNQLGLTTTQRINFNLTAAVIDTLAAKLASIEAVPQAVTNKGNAKGRQLAEDLNFILKGLFHKYQISHLINQAYKDAMINRAGYLKVLMVDGQLDIERVYIDEIIVDPADGYYNKPYKIIQRKSIPVHVMLKEWPQYKNKIMECEVMEQRKTTSRKYTPCIMVAEGWCKNSYMDKGRHVLTIQTADLVDEEWDKDYFPILKCDYNEPIIGFMGQSVVDDLDSIQKEIDRILITMQAIMKLISVPRVFIDSNSQVNKNHVTNKIGIMIEYDGKQGVAPIIHNGAAMPPELPAQVQFLIEQGYARAGLTPMDTQGQQKTGSGNTSGEALKTMTDIKSERWELLQRNYEHSHVELAEIILKELQGTNIKLSSLDRHIGLKEISTKKIPKMDTSYVLKMFPVSSLPDSIPDLIDSVTQLLQLGVIQPAQVPDLFNMPDLDAYNSMQAAPRKLVDKKLEAMMDGGKYWHPEPYHDLDYAIGKATQMYNWGQLNDEPEKSLSSMRRFINDVKSLIAQRTAAQNPQPPAGVNANGGQPTPSNPGSNTQPSQPGSGAGQPPSGAVQPTS